jgi:hypothetical protein
VCVCVCVCVFVCVRSVVCVIMFRLWVAVRKFEKRFIYHNIWYIYGIIWYLYL